MNSDDTLLDIETVGNSSVKSISATGPVLTAIPSWALSNTATTTAGISTTINWNSIMAVSDEKVLTDIICICSEDILTTILDRLQERNIAAAKSFIDKILDRRHLSEKFILDFIDIIDDKEDILQHHRAEILSGEYPSLALFFELNK